MLGTSSHEKAALGNSKRIVGADTHTPLSALKIIVKNSN